MRRTIDRRRFVKTGVAFGAGIGLGGWSGGGAFGAAAGKGAPSAKKLGWELCLCAYSFNALTFFEAVDKAKELGLTSIEGFNWQKLSPAKKDVQIGSAMSAADRADAKKKLSDCGVKMLSLYCRALKEEEASRKTFEFAQDMGIKSLVAEPPFEAYDMLEKLCDEYKVNLAVHNHPAPSQYWNPATTAKVCKGRSPRIGSCSDTGHWTRSGFNPVEALAMLKGRVINLHLKDVSEFGVKKAECVPWGTGKGDIGGILKELHGQGFKGAFGIEYEPYKPENFELITQCIEYFESEAAKLAAS